MRFLDLALCALLFLIAIFLLWIDVRDFQEFRKMQSNATSPFDNPIPLKFVSGYDSQGKEISTLPLGTKHLALFMLHGSSFQAEADIWNSIAERANGNIGFIGVCDNAACIKSTIENRGKLHFTSLTYGDYLALRGLMKIDSQGQIEILNRETGEIKAVQRPHSFTEFAGMIQMSIKEGL